MKAGSGFPRLYTWTISMEPQIDKINDLMTTHGACRLATEPKLTFKVCIVKGKKNYRKIFTPVYDQSNE